MKREAPVRAVSKRASGGWVMKSYSKTNVFYSKRMRSMHLPSSKEGPQVEVVRQLISGGAKD
jgi:hypothetical protein